MLNDFMPPKNKKKLESDFHSFLPFCFVSFHFLCKMLLFLNIYNQTVLQISTKMLYSTILWMLC